jgi:hypothetical protein
MTPNQFRTMALAMKGVVEGAHHGHPDFRVDGKIIASLHPGNERGMVVLTPEQQGDMMRDCAAFAPEAGAWGRKGCTRVELASVDEDALGLALTLAKQNIASTPGLKTRPPKDPKARPPRKKR